MTKYTWNFYWQRPSRYFCQLGWEINRDGVLVFNLIFGCLQIWKESVEDIT